MRGEQQRVEDEGRGTAEDNERASVLQGVVVYNSKSYSP